MENPKQITLSGWRLEQVIEALKDRKAAVSRWEAAPLSDPGEHAAAVREKVIAGAAFSYAVELWLESEGVRL